MSLSSPALPTGTTFKTFVCTLIAASFEVNVSLVPLQHIMNIAKNEICKYILTCLTATSKYSKVTVNSMLLLLGMVSWVEMRLVSGQKEVLRYQLISREEEN